MSHTSAVNLLIPIVSSVAVIAPSAGAIIVALASSLAMSLPIGTPPNAIAFATGTIETKEMAKTGSMVSLLGSVVLLLLVAALMNMGELF